MKEYKLFDIKKEEVTVRETKTEIGKVIIKEDLKTINIFSPCFDLDQVQEILWDIIRESPDWLGMPFAGNKIIPGDWTLIIQSEEL